MFTIFPKNPNMFPFSYYQFFQVRGSSGKIYVCLMSSEFCTCPSYTYYGRYCIDHVCFIFRSFKLCLDSRLWVYYIINSVLFERLGCSRIFSLFSLDERGYTNGKSSINYVYSRARNRKNILIRHFYCLSAKHWNFKNTSNGVVTNWNIMYCPTYYFDHSHK